MALTILLLLFIVLTLVTALGISLLFLIKKPKTKNIIFYFLSVWSVLIAFLNASSLPSNYILQRVMAWGFGLLAILAIFVKIKKPEKISLSYILVSASSILGLIDLFFFM